MSLIEIIRLNKDIQKDSPRLSYHMNHIRLARRYALLINKRLGMPCDESVLATAALAHDLFKEHGLQPGKESEYPQDLNAYVRNNLDTLHLFGLDDYFNTSVQYHPLAAGIYLHDEMCIEDDAILYPIMFHSCPIIECYEQLSTEIRTAVDIIMLADKLSSNWLKINSFPKEVYCDLDMIVFGESGHEFNYTLGLFIARLISQGKFKEEQGRIATEYYFKRLQAGNPLITKLPTIRRLGEKKIWPPRESRALLMECNSSER